MKKIFYIFITIILFTCPMYSKNDFDFAVHLYNENDYYRAISEFNRFIYYNPKHKKADLAHLYITKSYYYAGQYRQAVENTSNNEKRIRDKNIKLEMNLILARSYLFLGEFSSTAKILHTLESIENNSGSVNYHHIWYHIFKYDWEIAYDKMNMFIQKYPNSSYYKESLLIKDDLIEGVEFSPLSPTFAGILSGIIPGLGQVYAKRVGDGMMAFTLIALLSYGTYYYHENGPDGMFYGFAVLDAIFYLGNIYTAVNSSQNYNSNFNQQLRNKLVNSYSF